MVNGRNALKAELLILVRFALSGLQLTDGHIVVLYICFMLNTKLSFINIVTNGLKQLTQGE